MANVSIIIHCHNAGPSLLEALASVRNQTGCEAEAILVAAGTDHEPDLRILEHARTFAAVYCQTPEGGLAAARNVGFLMATADYVAPMSQDDLLRPGFATTALKSLQQHPEMAFAYCDYQVRGARKHVVRVPDYNLWDLLSCNPVTCAAMIRRRDWEETGGYDESLSDGFVDWEFWLRLGELGRFGAHFNGVLFERRSAVPRQSEMVDSVRRRHPGLYEYNAQAQIKRLWAPAVCIEASESKIGQQTIRDYMPARHEASLKGTAFLVPGNVPRLAADSAELAALAVWGGHQRLDLPDGSVALSRAAYLTDTAPRATAPSTAAPSTAAHMALPAAMDQFRRHLSNAGLLSPGAWLRHPLRSAGRLIPLRLKEYANAAFGRQVFDLQFYLQFNPTTVHPQRNIVNLLRYLPEISAQKRIALITPHLGVGGAEAVLLDVAASLDRSRYEIFVLATQSQSSQWRKRWEAAADHVYDLRELVALEKLGAAICSIVMNWEIDTLLVQNSLIGYAVLPHLKSCMPHLRTIDLLHSVDESWDIVSATSEVSNAIDMRVASSETVWRRLCQQGIADSRIRLIRNAVDLRRFSPRPSTVSSGPHRVLFVGRLDPVKRPLLLPKIAEELRRRRNREDFRFVIAGDGSEGKALAAEIRRRRLEGVFDLRGHMDNVAPLLEECALVILPSRSEGVPLILLEAFACCRTVVASAVGGVPEVVTKDTGVTIPLGPGEVSRFVDAIHELMEQPVLRTARAENGRRLVEQLFTRDRFLEEYQALLA